MVVSLFIQVMGCLLFVPAARMVSFPLFLTAVFVVGAGVTALQTSANPYVSILGPESSASIRLNLAQALNSLGGTLAPLVAGALHPVRPRPRLPRSKPWPIPLRMPYLLIAGALLAAGRGRGLHAPAARAADAGLPPRQGGRSDPEPQHLGLQAHGAGRAWHLLLCRRRSGLASIAVNYFSSQGMSTAKTASFLVSLYWLGALVGRVLGAAGIMTKVKAGQAARHLRLYRGGAHCHFDVYLGLGGHRNAGPVRVLQLGHVPQHLYAGHCRPRGR
jgi:MFS transporter, FHS family, L-fucose permease